MTPDNIVHIIIAVFCLVTGYGFNMAVAAAKKGRDLPPMSGHTVVRRFGKQFYRRLPKRHPKPSENDLA